MARLILVDDDPDLLTMARALLASSGHDVMTATGALEALDLLRMYGADAVITDANMPQISGYDLLKTLRKDQRFGAMPIAMLTGRREKRDIERALELGVDDYIIKPIDPMLFLKKIDHLLEKRPEHPRSQEIQFANAQGRIKCTAAYPAEIRSVSELGLGFMGPHKLTEGQAMRIESELFAQIGIEPPRMKVLSSIDRGADGFETRVLFIGVDEPTLQKIRAWIFAHTAKMASKAG